MASTSGDDKPLSRRECDHCQLKTEVANMKDWVGAIDKRQWAGIALAIVNLIAAVGALATILFKLLPALAIAGIK